MAAPSVVTLSSMICWTMRLVSVKNPTLATTGPTSRSLAIAGLWPIRGALINGREITTDYTYDWPLADGVIRASNIVSLPRIGILVVAYNAETTLRSVLQRIPSAIMSKTEEIFVFDDASTDTTHELGKKLQQEEF